MPKLPRLLVRQFGASGVATNFGQFGSKKAAAPQTTQNPSVIMSLAAWVNGWTQAAVGARFNPYLEDMNGFCLTVFYFIANIFERGIPDWDATTTYYKGAVCQDAAGSGQVFQSLTDNNIGNALPLGASNAQWQWFNAPQVPIGSSLDFMGVVIPSSYLWQDGTAFLRATYSALFSALNLTMNGTRGAGSPIITGIATTANLKAGWYAGGTGIPVGTKILSVDSANQVTLDQNAASSGTTPLDFGPWGLGDGVTTFNVPDTRRRVAVGAGGAATATLGNVLGAAGGEEGHVQTVAELVSHDHYEMGYSGGGGTHLSIPAQGTNDVLFNFAGLSTDVKGGGQAFNIIQPSYVCTKIIKAF